jgi:hypothetical protein
VAPPAPPARLLVVGVMGDELRAQQVALALDVWRRANRPLGIGPVAVVARTASGTVGRRTIGVLRPGRGALTGLLIGLLLLGLPAAGAAAVAAWAVGSMVFGLVGLVAVIPGDQVGAMVLGVTVGSAMLAFVLVGLVGGLAGIVLGLLTGIVDSSARGISRAEVTRIATMLVPGSWAAVARTRTPAAPLVRQELERLGATASTRPTGPDVPSAAVPAPATGSRLDAQDGDAAEVGSPPTER